jgi:hypothetical protein
MLIFLGVFACSKKNEQQQNINAENLQQPQEQEEIEFDDHQYEIVVDEQLKKQFEAEKNNTYGDPVYIFVRGKYNILESSVNIRSQPNLTSSVIGKLELHSEIKILYRTENYQTIDGMTHYWYKIRYEDITGYVWGGFISINTKVFDIDGKKINCYYRVSKLRREYTDDGWYSYDNLVTPNDVFIYIDKKRIKNTAIEKVYSDNSFVYYGNHHIREYWEFCTFWEASKTDSNLDDYQKVIREKNAIMFFKIESETSTGSVCSVFLINKNGEIIFVKNINTQPPSFFTP